MSTKINILIISDSNQYIREAADLLSDLDVIVHTAEGSARGLEKAMEVLPDGIIMDIQLHGTDGIELCRIIKSKKELSHSFLIFYTNQMEEYIQIAGLNAGADDFIIRPVRKRIMESRVNALLKRSSNDSNKDEERLITLGEVTIDVDQYMVLVDGNPLALPRKEIELLCLLAEKPGKVYSRKELSRQVWGEDDVVKGRTIDVHVRKIREKLGNKAIITIKGIGYKWTEAS